MPEGLSVSEVGKEIADHAHRAPKDEKDDDTTSADHSNRA